MSDCIESQGIPDSSLDKSLNIATWNVREFGKKKRRKDSIAFIARVLYQFDLIALTELRQDLTDLKRVMDLLGPHWRFVLSDWQPDFGGNSERIAFVFDTRIVEFTGLAAEAQPPRKKVGTEYVSAHSWWRSPYMASFRSGNYDFVLMAVHMRWGKAASRKAALKVLGQWIKKRFETHQEFVFDKDLILLGDFNIPRVGDSYYKALTEDSGLQLPQSLAGVNVTMATSDNHYDQILHRSTTVEFSQQGGVLDFNKDGLMDQLYAQASMTFRQKTYQLSDHLPLWLQVLTDNESAILDNA